MPREYLKQFITYGLFGLIAMITDIIILYCLTDLLQVHYLISVILSFTAAAFVNFLFQKKFTFKDHQKLSAKQFSHFLIIGIVGMAINLLVISVSVEYFHIWYIYGKLIAVMIAYIWNFNANRLFTFKK